MFGLGKSSQSNGFTPPTPPKASEVARLEGGGLVVVVVSNLAPFSYDLFLNDHTVSQMEIESLSIAIEGPDANGLGGTVRATLARYVTSVTGERSLQRTELFPCTIEIIAQGRRLAISASEANNINSVIIRLGLRPDGTSSELTGAQSLQILLTEGILDAKLTWTDGETEDLLPQQ